MFFNLFKRKIKTPVIKDNTFIVWEACSKSHSEVVPGFVKYLHNLGYHVSVLVEPKRLKEGLFSKFNLDNVTYNKLTGKETRKFFKTSDLSKIKGVIVTTAGKICDRIHWDECYDAFNETLDKKKLFIVEHDIKLSVDAGSWREDIITLRKMNYKGAKTVAVNPHYYGDVNITPKNSDIVNFLTVGVIKPRKKNNSTIINSVLELHKKGIRNFKVTVVGKGKIKGIPAEIKKYFEIKGALPFSKMYEEIEKADYFITAYDAYNEKHIRYNTTGTSGNFQLIYGFLKPVLINKVFAPINGLNEKNSIIYKGSDDYTNAMIRAINLTEDEYAEMQNNLRVLEKSIYLDSLNNLETLLKRINNE